MVSERRSEQNTIMQTTGASSRGVRKKSGGRVAESAQPVRSAITGIIDGVKVFPLKRIQDERGMVMHMLRADDPHFERFGEIYFSVIYPGVIKAWHIHSRMTINYAVVEGNIKLVLYDQRPNSPTKGILQEIVFGQVNYQLVRVPPGVVNGFTAVGRKGAIVANCADIPHDPDEITRIDPFVPSIPYSWEIKHG